MWKILVVEDSSMVLKVLKHVLSAETLFQPLYATDFAQAKQLIKENDDIFAALVDLTLPDAPNGEVVDYTLENTIPTIVLTGSFDEERRKALLEKGIVDYVTKEGRYSYVYVVGLLKRLVKNQDINVLVVDDSETSRRFITTLLKLHLYKVVEAKDGIDAIKILIEQPDIKLLITDYNMPRMNGCELIKNIRVKYEKSDLVIIGLSSEESGSLSARFIKSGANDFLRKPFHHEEFYCRVTQNVEVLELIESVQDKARRDPLTGVYNTNYFHEIAQQKHLEKEHDQRPLSIGVIFLNEMEQIIANWGSDVGEIVLKEVAAEFQRLFQKYYVARSDGATFYVLLNGLDNDKACAYLERVRQILASNAIATPKGELSTSFSGGVSSLRLSNVEQLINTAFANLHRALDAGGDLVFGDEED